MAQPPPVHRPTPTATCTVTVITVTSRALFLRMTRSVEAFKLDLEDFRVRARAPLSWSNARWL
jgi:hypothetical protein